MHGVINKITAVAGKRDELITLVLTGVDVMPGCLSYVVSIDVDDADAFWVTEVWTTVSSQTASLSFPAIKDALEKAMPLIGTFEPIATTEPIGGIGLTR